MQIAMSNTISRTLSKDQIGVGMGLLSLLNFIAGAITTSILGKTLDSSSSFHLNPVVSNVRVFNFSNIFTVLALIALVTMGLYALQFRRGHAVIRLLLNKDKHLMQTHAKTRV